jgi:hypothetical protein
MPTSLAVSVSILPSIDVFADSNFTVTQAVVECSSTMVVGSYSNTNTSVSSLHSHILSPVQ